MTVLSFLGIFFDDLLSFYACLRSVRTCKRLRHVIKNMCSILRIIYLINSNNAGFHLAASDLPMIPTWIPNLIRPLISHFLSATLVFGKITFLVLVSAAST